MDLSPSQVTSPSYNPPSPSYSPTSPAYGSNSPSYKPTSEWDVAMTPGCDSNNNEESSNSKELVVEVINLENPKKTKFDLFSNSSAVKNAETSKKRTISDFLFDNVEDRRISKKSKREIEKNVEKYVNDEKKQLSNQVSFLKVTLSNTEEDNRALKEKIDHKKLIEKERELYLKELEERFNSSEKEKKNLEKLKPENDKLKRENDDLNKEKEELSKQLKTVRKKVSELQKKSHQLSALEKTQKELELDGALMKRKLEKLKEEKKCKLCAIRKNNCFLNTCGHVFCGQCIYSLGSKECPSCKTQFSPKYDVKVLYV